MRANYRVEFNKRYLKDLEKIPSKLQKQIGQKIRDLAFNPRPDGCKKLQGSDDLYRIRCGDYRVVYTIKDEILLVLIIEIGHRREIYR